MSKEKKQFSLLIVMVLALTAALVASFVGISFFKTQTDQIVELTDARYEKFAVIFEELKKARLRAMGIGADTLLLSKRTVDPFVQRDRKALAEVIDPFFQFAKKKHGIEQINFFIPPGILFYRAEAPELGQFDITKYRNTIKAAIENQERIMAVETGQGGVVAIRGIVPIFQDERFYGVIEFVSNFDIPLENAAFESKMKWAISLSDEVWKKSERPSNEKKDIHKGTDTYFQYSDDAAENIIRNTNFDPRDKNYAVLDSNDRKVFIKTIKVLNFVGVPTITIAVIDDLTERFSTALMGAVVRGGITFLLLGLVLIIGYLKFDDMRHGLLGAVSAERRAIKEQLEQGKIAIEKLKEVEIIKRRFFSNLLNAMSEPLLAIRGQLKTAMLQADAINAKKELIEPLSFAMHENERIQKLVSDYEQIELLRQNLVRPSADLISISQVAKNIQNSAALYQRFPNFNLSMQVAEMLPQTRGDASQLERALMALIAYAADAEDPGSVVMDCRQDSDKWLCISFSGTAFDGQNTPTESLLDASRQFLSQLSGNTLTPFKNEKVLNICLCKIIVECMGGSLMINTREAGFIVQLPAAI